MAAQPKILWQGGIKVFTHTDFTTVLAKDAFIGLLGDRDQLDSSLVISSDDDFISLLG
jgi:hypothetical protein